MSYDDNPIFMSNIKSHEVITKPSLKLAKEILEEKQLQKSDPSPLLQEWIKEHPNFDPAAERHKWKKLR